MIKQIIIDTKANVGESLSYIKNLPAVIANDGVFEFKEGLNIIVGPNGSGKTTILRAIANYLAATHTGESCITEKWLAESFGSHYPSFCDSKPKALPYKVVHDGQPIMFGDPRRSFGMTKSGVDEEFYGAGLNEYLEVDVESAGEQSNRRLMPFLKVLAGEAPFPKGLTTTLSESDLKEKWGQHLDVIVSERFKASVAKGQPTILFDEPEGALGLLNQILLWNKYLKSKDIQDKFQIIVISHSHICLDIEGANYIELKEGYVDACRKLLNGELDESDAKVYATKVEHKLTASEIRTLKLISASPNGKELKTKSDSLKRLIELDFVREYSKRVKHKSDGNGRRSFGFHNFVEVYAITHRGEQYLNLHN